MSVVCRDKQPAAVGGRYCFASAGYAHPYKEGGETRLQFVLGGPESPGNFATGSANCQKLKRGTFYRCYTQHYRYLR